MKNKTKLILFSLLVIGLFLRLFKFQELFHFTMDEALVAFRGLGLFKYNRPFLIGGISPLQVHLPPYFYYLASVFLAIFKFNPAGWGIWAALIGILTIISLYFLVKKISNQKTALITSTLYTFSFTTIFFDRRFWPLSFNPLLTILSLFLLTRLNKKSFKYYLLLFLTLTFAFTADPSNIPLILTSITFIVLNIKKLNSKFLNISSAIASAVFITPLLLFDLRHNWENIKGVNRLFNNISVHQFSFQKLIDAILLIPRTLTRFWYSPQTNLVELHSYCIPHANARQQNLPMILVILAIAAIVWFVKTSKKPIEKTINKLFFFYLFGITLFGALGFSIFDHYLSGLLPIFAFITAKFLSKLPKSITLIAISIFLITNLYQFSQASNPYGLKHKQDLIFWANQELRGQDFALDSISKCHRENGLRYLFELTDNPPKQSFMDPNFFWLYQQFPAETIPDKVLLVTDKPINTNLPIISQEIFGALNAYLLDNQGKAYQLNQ